MSDTADAAVPDQGLLSRAIGVIVSPTQTFRTVIAYPRPATFLLFVCLLFGLATAVPQFTEHGRQQLLDAQVQAYERLMHQPVTPQMLAGLQSGSRYAGYTTFGSVFISIPVVALLITAVYWAIFNALLGGTASFKQVLGIVAHSTIIGALGVIVSAPIIWVKGIESFAGPFNLGALVPMLESTHPVSVFLTSVSVFTLWQIVVSAIGLAVLYRRNAGTIATVLVGAYLFLAAGFSTLFSSLTSR